MSSDALFVSLYGLSDTISALGFVAEEKENETNGASDDISSALYRLSETVKETVLFCTWT